MDPDGDLEAFYFFSDDLVPCVAGQKVWTLREKAIKSISEAKKVVSVLDEAFIILVLMNYWERSGNGTARWTDSKVGNYQYMGWADAAYLQFDELCKQILEQRQTRLNKKLEQIYLQDHAASWQEEDHTPNVWVDWLKQMWRYTMNWTARGRISPYQ
jgi:hypothetical protein